MKNENYYKYLEARDFTKKGKYKEAIKLLTEIHEEEPYDKTAKIALIKTLVINNQLKEAQYKIKTVINESNIYECEFGMLEMGIINVKTNNKEEAYKNLLPLIKQDSKYKYTALFQLGKIEMINQNLEQAKKYYIQALENDKRNNEKSFALFELGKIELAQGNLEQARKYFIPLLNGSKKDRAYALHKLGQLEIKNNNYEKAREYFQLLLNTNNKKDKSFALFELGVLEQNLGNIKEASNYFDELQKIEMAISSYTKKTREKEKVTGKLTEGSKLESHLETFLLSDNKKIKHYAMIELGKHEAKIGNIEKAKEYLTPILKDGTDKEKSHVFLELAKLEIKSNNLDKAKKYLEPLKNNIYISYAAKLELGKIAFMNGEKDNAYKYFKSLLTTQVQIYAKFELLKLCITEKKYEEALSYLYDLLEENFEKEKLIYYLDYIKTKIKKDNSVNKDDTYFYKQLNSYNKELAIENIKENKNAIGNKLKYSEFDKDLDIDELYEEMQYVLPNLEAKNNGIYDKYLYDYGATIGVNNDKKTSTLIIITWCGTNEILTIYPIENKSKFKTRKLKK